MPKFDNASRVCFLPCDKRIAPVAKRGAVQFTAMALVRNNKKWRTDQSPPPNNQPLMCLIVDFLLQVTPK
jgi:hypothetical protein